VRLEIELVFRATASGRQQEQEILIEIERRGGRLISRTRIEDIAYHAVLADLPVAAVRSIADRATGSIASLESVMHIRPQSVASGILVTEEEGGDASVSPQTLGDPILALLDGVPVAGHRLLNNHLIIDDQFGLVPDAPVARRVHGTAMASL
jgi:hypothetical protein